MDSFQKKNRMNVCGFRAGSLGPKWTPPRGSCQLATFFKPETLPLPSKSFSYFKQQRILAFRGAKMVQVWADQGKFVVQNVNFEHFEKFWRHFWSFDFCHPGSTLGQPAAFLHPATGPLIDAAVSSQEKTAHSPLRGHSDESVVFPNPPPPCLSRSFPSMFSATWKKVGPKIDLLRWGLPPSPPIHTGRGGI